MERVASKSENGQVFHDDTDDRHHKGEAFT
jgi:hypothetical protein